MLIEEKVKQTALQRIAFWEELKAMLTHIDRSLNAHHHYNDKKLEDALNTIRYALIDQELDAYRNYLMWIVFAGTHEELKTAKIAVYEKFLKDGIFVMDALDIQGKMPSFWHEETKKELRQMIEETLDKE